MKKLISIFFLFTFFLFQYGKILDYWECRIAAAIESKSDCGCDNNLNSASSSEQSSQPLHQHHLKNYTEEFFYHSGIISAKIFRNNQQYTIALYAEDELSGYLTGILQPPRI